MEIVFLRKLSMKVLILWMSRDLLEINKLQKILTREICSKMQLLQVD